MEAALNKLGRLEMGTEMEEEVFKILKLSYDNLMDSCLQNCLLHCASYSEINRHNMIMKLLESGAINGRRSLREIYDEGHTILNELQDHSLLSENRTYLRMQNSVRNMACHILKESQRCMVRCDQRLRAIPHVQEWTADLELVSLNRNLVREIPAVISPYCPRLSTLILRNNDISNIPDCFFTHMKSLAILDLSQNHSLTSLPDSLSDLTCLVSLVLRYCLELKHVPTLEGLQKLSRLVISGTSVEVIPGLEMLTNLRWLDLSHNEELRFESRSLLRGLTNLQYLDLFNATLLTNLQYEYCLLMQIAESEWVLEAYDGIDPSGEDYQFLHLLDCEESPHLLPKDLTNLCIEYNTCWKSLCDALSDNTPSSLMNIKIEGCIRMKSLFCLFGNCSFCNNLPNFQSLQLRCLESLRVICKEDVADTDTTTQPLSPMLSSLISRALRSSVVTR